MSGRNDILSNWWNKNRKIGMNIVTFAMVFAIVLVALGGIGCIGGGDSGADANTNDGGATNPSAGESQTDSPSVTDTTTTSETANPVTYGMTTGDFIATIPAMINIITTTIPTTLNIKL